MRQNPCIAKQVRELRISGKSIDEICNIVDYPRHEIVRICRESGMGITTEEQKVAKNRQDRSFAHDEDWAKQYILEKSGGQFEYISGYINMDSPVRVKCTKCGYEQTKRFSRFRGHSHVLCESCRYDPYAEMKQMKRELRRQEKERELVKRKIEKETAKLIRAGRGSQLSFGFCSCGEILDRFDGSTGRQCRNCARRALNKNKELKRRHIMSKVMIDSDITIQKLFHRDNGVCYLCGELCDWEDKVIRGDTIICGNRYPSIDHVIPLAKGGLHSWNNIKLAHRICNSLKADKLA